MNITINKCNLSTVNEYKNSNILEEKDVLELLFLNNNFENNLIGSRV